MEIVAYPGKRKTQITKEENGVIYLDVKGKAKNNEANNEIIRFFSKKYNKDIKIIRGLKSRKKTVIFN